MRWDVLILCVVGLALAPLVVREVRRLLKW